MTSFPHWNSFFQAPTAPKIAGQLAVPAGLAIILTACGSSKPSVSDVKKSVVANLHIDGRIWAASVPRLLTATLPPSIKTEDWRDVVGSWSGTGMDQDAANRDRSLIK